jgi:hypothetical protein
VKSRLETIPVNNSMLILAAVLALGSVTAQEVKHAPMAAQCRADQRLWFSKIGSNDLADVTYRELHAWADEMVDCMAVDGASLKDYGDTSNMARITYGDRAEHFISRHNLMDQFIAEDAAGKR